MALTVTLMANMEPEFKFRPHKVAGCFATGGIVVPELIDHIMTNDVKI